MLIFFTYCWMLLSSSEWRIYLPICIRVILFHLQPYKEYIQMGNITLWFYDQATVVRL